MHETRELRTGRTAASRRIPLWTILAATIAVQTVVTVFGWRALSGG